MSSLNLVQGQFKVDFYVEQNWAINSSLCDNVIAQLATLPTVVENGNHLYGAAGPPLDPRAHEIIITGMENRVCVCFACVSVFFLINKKRKMEFFDCFPACFPSTEESHHIPFASIMFQEPIYQSISGYQTCTFQTAARRKPPLQVQGPRVYLPGWHFE